MKIFAKISRMCVINALKINSYFTICSDDFKVNYAPEKKVASVIQIMETSGISLLILREVEII